MKYAAVIPCFNESNTIARVVSALQRYLDVVIVVDDGSTDKTTQKAKKAGATVIRHEHNYGKGTALRTGLSELLSQGFEWAVMLDGDGQHAPADLPAFLECAEQTGAPLVIGDRMHAADTMPWIRRWANRWMSRKLSRYAQRHLPDTQSGFRLLHLPTWASLELSARHFEVESEMLMAFLAAKHAVEFVPIRVIPGGRTSRIHPIVDSVRWLKWWRAMKRNSAAQPALKISKPPCAMAAAQEI